MPTLILQDPFTNGTGSNVAIDSRTPASVGGTGTGSWTVLGGVSVYDKPTSSVCIATPGSEGKAEYGTALSTADGYATMTVTGDASPATGIGGALALRKQGDGKMYIASWTSTDLYLYYYDGASYNQLATIAGHGLPTSATATFKIDVTGTAIKVYKDAVERLSVTNGSIAAAGKFEFRVRDSEVDVIEVYESGATQSQAPRTMHQHRMRAAS